jgi:hypothetical protein
MLTAETTSTSTVDPSLLVVDPTLNYRWGSEEAMRADLTRTTRDESGNDTNEYGALVQSVKTAGRILVPIGVMPDEGRYRVIYGFTRAMVARELGIPAPVTIHEAGMSDDEIRSLQLMENSAGVRRSVHWVAETRGIRDAHAAREKVYKDMIPSRRPKGPDGKVLTPNALAWRDLADRMGRSTFTLMDRVSFLRIIPAVIVEHAEKHGWSLGLCKEFHSGDCDRPYSDEFLRHIIDELKRNCPDLSRVTQKSVTSAKVRVHKWLTERKDGDKGPLWRTGVKSGDASRQQEDATPAVTEETLRVNSRRSPSASRDLAVVHVGHMLVRAKLTLARSEADWESVRKTSTWYRVCGIGIGCGESITPDRCVDLSENADMPDLDVRCEHFAISVFVAAGLRNELTVRIGQRAWSTWYRGESIGAGRKTNAGAYRDAVAAGVMAKGGIRARIQVAVEHLHDSGMCP